MVGTSFILTVIFTLLQNLLISSNPSLFVLTNPSVFYYTSISKLIWKACPLVIIMGVLMIWKL